MNSTNASKAVRVALGCAAAVAAGVWPAAAPSAAGVAEFYKGRTVTVYVGVSVGGSYSTFARILARHLGRHIPGAPAVIVQHMPGTAGTKAMNHVYNVAPQDGTVTITPNSGIAKRVLLRIGKPKYDPTRINWLGGAGEAVSVLTVLKGSPVSSLEEAKRKVAVIGAIGKSSNTYLVPNLINNIIGTRFKIISGYRGGSRIRLALERGELDGYAGFWSAWKLRKPDWVRDGKLIHLVQLANKRAPDLPNVPQLADFATNDDQRAILRFVQTGLADRAYAAGPGVPADRVAALSAAYQATLRDPAFLAEATKRQYTIDPVSAEDVRAAVAEMMKMPPALVEKMRAAMGLK